MSAICMLRESSSSTPMKFCCGTAAWRTSTGRNRQTSSSADQRGAQRRQHDAVAVAQAARRALVADGGHRHRGGAGQHRQPDAGGGGETQFALVEDDPAHAEEELGQPVEHGSNHTSRLGSPVVRAARRPDSRILVRFDAPRRRAAFARAETSRDEPRGGRQTGEQGEARVARSTKRRAQRRRLSSAAAHGLFFPGRFRRP